MTLGTNEIALLKYGGGTFISMYAIKQAVILFKFILGLKNKPVEATHKENENSIKEQSRLQIHETHENVQNIKETMSKREDVFFNMYTDIKETKKIIGKDHDGVPLIYNKVLEKEMVTLNFNMTILATSIQNLADKSK